MNLADLRSLDVQNIGSWPGAAKALVILVLCAAVLGAGYWFDTRHQLERRATAQEKETKLRSTFEAKQRKAANLEPLKQQLVEMEQSFGEMLQLLPNKTEIEGLLVDISQSGLAAGLEFELFKPGSEAQQEFYAIQPIDIRVVGDYHEFGEYISAVAALPRIVTQHDISLTPKPQDTSGELTMNVKARTYRYLDEEEIAEQEAAKAMTNRGGRR